MLEPDILTELDRTFLEEPVSLSAFVVALQNPIQQCEARQHPYGFTVVTLGTVPGHRRVVYRLHIWPLGFVLPGSAELMIHDHVYDIRSHVLAGHLVQHEYTESEGGTEFARYCGIYDGPHSMLERMPGTLRVAETAVTKFKAGQTYGLPAGALHMVKVDPNVFTATILRTEYTKDAGNPVILAPIDAPLGYRFDRDLVPDGVAGPVVDALFKGLTPARGL